MGKAQNKQESSSGQEQDNAQDEVKDTSTDTAQNTPTEASDKQSDTASEVSSTAQVTEPAVTPVAVETVVEPVVTTEVQSADTDGLSQSAAILISELDEYISDMNPAKPQTVATGIVHQKRLWRILMKIINTTGDEFPAVFDVVLSRFQQHQHGALSPDMVNRFLVSIKLDKEQSIEFSRLINALIATADPSTRKAVVTRSLKISTIFGPAINQEGQQNLIKYYEV